MLALTRKEGQSIIIGGDIEIYVASIDGNQVRLGIRAPKDMEIHRKEIVDAIREESEKSAQSSGNLKRFQDDLKALLQQGGEK